MSLCTLAASPRQALRGIIALVSVPLPEPTVPARSRAEVFVRYLDYFRSRVITKIEGLPERALRQSRLPSGWTPLELLKHLSYVELRWLEWGFEGRPITDPWGDNRGDRWYVAQDETLEHLVAALRTQAERSRAVIEAHDLAERGKPGPPGPVPTPRLSSASCSIWSRSTRDTSDTSTSSQSSPPGSSGSNPPWTSQVPWVAHCPTGPESCGTCLPRASPNSRGAAILDITVDVPGARVQKHRVRLAVPAG